MQKIKHTDIEVQQLDYVPMMWAEASLVVSRLISRLTKVRLQPKLECAGAVCVKVEATLEQKKAL